MSPTQIEHEPACLISRARTRRARGTGPTDPAAAVVSLLWFAVTGREEAVKRLIGFVSAVLATAFVNLMVTGPIGADEHVRIGVMVLALGVFVTPVVPWRWRFGWLRRRSWDWGPRRSVTCRCRAEGGASCSFWPSRWRRGAANRSINGGARQSSGNQRER